MTISFFCLNLFNYSSCISPFSIEFIYIIIQFLYSILSCYFHFIKRLSCFFFLSNCKFQCLQEFWNFFILFFLFLIVIINWRMTLLMLNIHFVNNIFLYMTPFFATFGLFWLYYSWKKICTFILLFIFYHILNDFKFCKLFGL